MVALGASILVHVVFCLQAITVADRGGMVRNTFFMLLYYPHVLLMYFLPPAYPIGNSHGVVQVDWLRFAGKLAVAYPASLLYGLVAGAFSCFIRGRRTA
jgi:hypothetical protein